MFINWKHFQDEALSLEEVRIKVVQILGSLGGHINKSLVAGKLLPEVTLLGVDGGLVYFPPALLACFWCGQWQPVLIHAVPGSVLLPLLTWVSVYQTGSSGLPEHSILFQISSKLIRFPSPCLFTFRIWNYTWYFSKLVRASSWSAQETLCLLPFFFSDKNELWSSDQMAWNTLYRLVRLQT